jgi:GNAT superfamily N-acetyltransferase
MIFREAHINDIRQIMTVRFAVKENILSSPALVTDKDCEEYITARGKGWVCEMERSVVDFAIADLLEKSIWALFVHPEYEKKGIGRRLHDDMLNWYFSKTKETVWLTTAPVQERKCFTENRAGRKKAESQIEK